jgi:hypothetical protein
MTSQLFNAILISTGEPLQVYMTEGSSTYASPKYPGRRFRPDELTIVSPA